jgi:hypothetical protein
LSSLIYWLFFLQVYWIILFWRIRKNLDIQHDVKDKLLNIYLITYRLIYYIHLKELKNEKYKTILN